MAARSREQLNFVMAGRQGMMTFCSGTNVRFLILSDIHSNLEALEAVLAAAPAYDVVVNLGDIVGYGASPNEVIDRSRELGKIFVRGNHDKACSGIADVRGFNFVAAAAVVWTHHALRPDNLEWLKALPQGPLPLDPLADVQVVHGSPRDEDEYLLASDHAADSADEIDIPLTFFGHTHMQGGFLITGSQEITFHPKYQEENENERWEFALDRPGKYLINPGSVGQPRDGDWRAAFATYDSDSRQITFFRVVYDIATAQKRIREAQLPERLAERLVHGR